MDARPERSEGLSRPVVLTSALAAALAHGWLASGRAGIAPAAAVAFALTFAIARLSLAGAIVPVLLMAYVAPAVTFAAFGASDYHTTLIWLAALLGPIAAQADFRRWHIPGRWRWPFVAWALVIAVTWPIITWPTPHEPSSADGWVARNFARLGLAESEEMREDRHYLEETATRLRNEGLKVTVLLALGDPPAEILNAARAESCDLIAMTSHGHRLLGDLLFGSTIDHVRHRSDIPLLVVRATPNG